MVRGEFDDLLLTFTWVLERHALRQPRQRAIGGGFKGVLDTPGKKLFFVLFYLKVYPTFDVLGFDDRVAVVSAGLWKHHLASLARNPS